MPNTDLQPLHLLVGTARDPVFEAVLERLAGSARVDREVAGEALTRRASSQTYDAYVIDEQLPAEGAVDPIRQLTHLGKAPILIVGVTSQELSGRVASAAEYVALDATDARAFARLLHRVVERARRAGELPLSRDVLEAVAERVPVMVAVMDTTGHVIWINREHERVLGWSDDELRHSHFTELCGSDALDRDRAAHLLAAADGSWETFRLRRRQGHAIETSWVAFRLHDGTFIAVGRDLTEQRDLSLRLARAEKLEALGRLSGGIAHDFNNLLTVIAGNAQLLLDTAQGGPDVRPALEEMARAAENAGAMVKRLLAFSGREPQPPSTVDLNATIESIRDMVTRLIGSDVRLAFELDAHPSIVRLDIGQIEQIVINLLLNARDAMPGGGRVQVRTGNADASPVAGARRQRLQPGKYVTLSVTDTGRGMDAGTRVRIFEPFFTTKGAAGGTGLGLASVHAIVAQAGGGIDVTSAPGQGSSFTLFLPSAVPESRASARVGSKRAATHAAAVLVVEDHDVIRRLCRRVLEKEGHQVTEASSAEDALRRAREMKRLDLILADVRLGAEDGLALARALRADHPGARVLLMSGAAGPDTGDAAFLEKPFTPAALVSAVRQLLEGK